MRSREFQRESLIALLLLAMVMLPFLREILLTGDLPTIYEPLIVDIELTGRLMAQSGELPLWNPYNQLGAPVFTEPRILIAYPLALVNHLFPLNTGMNVEVILHLWLAGWGFYWLIRDLLPGSRLPAIFTAVCYMCSGALIPRIEPALVDMVRTTAWIGWIMWAYHRLIHRPSLTWAAATGLVVGLEVLAAHPFGILRVLLVPFLMGSFYIARAALQRRWRDSLIILGWSALAVVIAVGLVSYKVIPALEAGNSLGRLDQGVQTDTGRNVSIGPVHLLSIVMPLQWYDLEAQGPFAFGDFEEFSIYAGVIGLFVGSLAIFSPDDRRRKQAVLLFAFGVFGLALATNLFSYWDVVSDQLPFLRIPSRFGLWWVVAQCMLAGYGLKTLLDLFRTADRDRLLLRTRWIALALTLVTVILVGVSLLWIFRGEYYTSLLRNRGFFDFVAPDVFFRSQTYTFLSLTFTLILAATMSWLALRGIRPDLLAALIVVALFVEMQTFVWPVFPHDIPRKLLSESERARSNLDPSVIRLEGQGAIAYGVPHVSTNRDGTELVRTFNLMALGLNGGRGSQLIGSGFVIADQIGDREGLHPFEGGWIPSLYEYDNNLPRIYLVPAVEVVEDEQAALAYVASEEFDAFSQAVVIRLVGEDGPDLPNESTQQPSGDAAFTDYRNNSFQARVTVDQPVIVVFAEMYYPGWRAWLDDELTRIWQTNYTLRGIVVEPGTHTIEMRYQPVGAYLGLGLSLVSFLVVLIITASTLLRNRKSLTVAPDAS